MKAFGANVVLTPAVAPEVSTGGLVLPESVGRAYKCRGIITDVGPGVEQDANLKVGDEIIFTTGSKFTVDDTQYIVVATKDILVIL